MTQIVLLEAVDNDGDVYHAYLDNPAVMAWYRSANHLPIPDPVLAAVRANPDDDYYDDGTPGAWDDTSVIEELEAFISMREPARVLFSAAKHVGSARELQEVLRANPTWQITEEIHVRLT